MHPLKKMIMQRQQGHSMGIPSYCSASELVIETALERAKVKGQPVLIEATANQVNQYGGYTGMKPADYVKFVMKIAERVACPKHLIILGGDHLGPLIWAQESEKSAMEKSQELVYEYVSAGFTKIHLDTSMKLRDDPVEGVLDTRIIARRGACLYKKSMEAFETLKEKGGESVKPVFVIGSEVPIPGGAQEKEEGLSVTKPEDFVNTVSLYRETFREEGIDDAWDNIIAVVVQPGVEFGDSQVFMYEADKAAALCHALKEYPDLVFEGHSTDYQSPQSLKEMVRDGIAILKVGPALTFGLREALFALELIEKELIPTEKRAGLTNILEQVMTEDPANWKNHYHGSEKEKALKRKFSFSDRSRYYMGEKKLEEAINMLFFNLSQVEIPMGLLHQYMPIQYNRIRDGNLLLAPRELAKAGIVTFMEDYEYAVKGERI